MAKHRRCVECGDIRTEPYKCNICNRNILKHCPECHNEIKHRIIKVSSTNVGKNIARGDRYAAGDFDSWGNVVREYEGGD